jgi:hypothetical protein
VLAARAVATLWLVALAWSWYFARPLAIVLIVVAILAMVGGAALGAIHLHRQWATRQHRRSVVRPLHLALHPQLDGIGENDPLTYLHVPADYAEPAGGPVIIDLPERFDGLDGRRQAIEAIVTAKLALPDIEYVWKLTGQDHHVVARPVHRPPASVLFTDRAVRQVIEAADEPAPVLGLGRSHHPVSIDLDTATPHVGISAGTGAGKSVLLRAMVAHLLHCGAVATVVDPKRFSLRAFADLPGVDYLKDIEDIHAGLIAVAGEAGRRNRLADERGGEALADLRRHVLVIDEQNTLMAALKAYWARERPRGGARTSPAIDALSAVLFLGREVRVNAIVSSQALTVGALGGGAAGSAVREQFGARILGRASRQAWGFLAPGIAPPAQSRHAGRMHLVIGDQVSEVQVTWMTEDEARAYAVAGDRPAHQGSGVIGGRVFAMPEPATTHLHAVAEIDR